MITENIKLLLKLSSAESFEMPRVESTFIFKCYRNCVKSSGNKLCACVCFFFLSFFPLLSLFLDWYAASLESSPNKASFLDVKYEFVVRGQIIAPLKSTGALHRIQRRQDFTLDFYHDFMTII